MNIVITGASKGIGLAIAERFSHETTPHSFALCARNETELGATRDQLAKTYPQHSYYCGVCDVSNEEQVLRFVGLCNDKLGTIDILVNNAGFGIFKPVTELSVSEFRSVLGANLRGVFLLTKNLLPAMRAKKSGTVITISSIAGKNGFSGGGAYCASKFAVRGLMQCLFLEVRTDNIRCITICPGSVETDFFKDIHNPNTSTKMLSASDIAESVWLSAYLPISATISEIEIRPTNPKG